MIRFWVLSTLFYLTFPASLLFSYIKLFHYGASHHGPFALIYDDYPHVRVFKLDGSG
jgi:hypothetical protein